MSKEVVDRIFALLNAGNLPTFKLYPRRGRDVRIMQITGTDNRNFYGVFIDSKQKQSLILPHISIINGTLRVEEMEIP